MEIIEPIQSSHLRELLRFAEQKYNLPISYGRPVYPDRYAVIIPAPTVVGDSITIPTPDEEKLQVARLHEGEVYLSYDFDRILLGSVNPPEQWTERVRFVVEALDAAIEAAVEAYLANKLKRVEAEFVRGKLRAINQRIRQLDQESSDCSYRIRDVSTRLFAIWRQKATVDQQREAYRSYTKPQLRESAEREFGLLWGLVPQRFSSIVIDDDRVRLETKAISIEHDGGVYDMGRFQIAVPFTNDLSLKVLSLDHPTPHSSYPHPHVQTSGEVCWGNLTDSVAECRAAGDLFHLATFALNLLESYNPGSPYAELERWDPDWQDEDRYENCYEDASPFYDCISCDDDNCRYWSSRYSRCWSAIADDLDADDLTRCSNCAECDYHIRATELLDEDNEESEEEAA